MTTNENGRLHPHIPRVRAIHFEQRNAGTELSWRRVARDSDSGVRAMLHSGTSVRKMYSRIYFRIIVALVKFPRNRALARARRLPRYSRFDLRTLDERRTPRGTERERPYLARLFGNLSLVGELTHGNEIIIIIARHGRSNDIRFFVFGIRNFFLNPIWRGPLGCRSREDRGRDFRKISRERNFRRFRVSCVAAIARPYAPPVRRA